MPPITYSIHLDTLRTGTFAGAIDDITGYVVSAEWGFGMNSPYQELADVSNGRLMLDNRLKYFTPETTGSELISNPTFASANWTGDNPNNWTVTGESGSDPEISQVADYEGHGGSGTGSANFYSTTNTLSISQTILTVGRSYCVSLRITNSVEGAIRIYNGSTAISPKLRNPGTYLYYFYAGATSLKIESTGAVDITIDDVSCKQTNLYRMMSKGMLVRIQGVYSSDTNQYYIGRIADIDYGIDPRSGQIGGQAVTLTLEDPLKDLIDAEYQPPLLENVTAHDIITRLVDDGAVRWPYSSQFWLVGVQGASEVGETTTLYDPTIYSGEAGITTHSFVGDFADRGHGVSGYGYIRDVVEAECGGRFWWDGRVGAFKFHSRHHDILNNTVAATLTTADLIDIGYVQTPQLYNRVTINYTERKVGAANSVIWQMGGLPMRLVNGDRKTVTARYRDPDNTGVRIGIKNEVTPYVGVDYICNFNEDGNGTDVSTFVTVSVEWGATSAKVTFDNHSGFTIYLTYAQLRATPLIAVPSTVEALNPDSIYTYDVHELTKETRALSDIVTADAYAGFLAAKFGNPIAAIESIRFKAFANSTTASAAHDRAIGDRVTITDSYTGHDADYVIVGERHSYSAGSGDGQITSYVLKPVARETFWRVGTADYSEVGVTTRLAF